MRLTILRLFLGMAASFAFQAPGYRAARRRGSVVSYQSKKPLTPAQRLIQKTIREKENKTGFDKLKKSVYDGVDNIQSIATSLEDKGTETKIFGGYSEKAEEKKARKSPLSIIPTTSLVGMRKEQTGRDTGDNASEKSSNPFLFLKEAVMDGASLLEGTDSTEDAQGEVVATSTKTESRPVYSRRVLEMYPDLESPNLLKRTYAELQAELAERKEKARKAQLEREEQFRQFKKGVYEAGDRIQEAVETVAATPGKIQKGVKATFDAAQAVPGQLQRTYEEVQAIPGKVEQKANEIQESVTVGIETGKKVVDDIKAIPGKVRALPDEAKRKAKETQDGFNEAVDSVNEFSTNIKVFLGIEKPKPKPPKTPPPPPTSPADQLLQVAGTLAFGAGKLALWVGGKVVGATVEASKDALENSSKTLKDESASIEKTARMVISEPETTASESENEEVALELEAKKETNDVVDTAEVERQVKEALDLASNVLEEAKKIRGDKQEKE